MNGWIDHLIVAPVALPLIAAAFMLLLDERRRNLKAVISLVTTAAVLVIALGLLHTAATGGGDGGDTARVYTLGAWEAPFGIVLVADRLSTMMLALSSVLGLGSLIFALARWDRAGPRFHSLFLLLLMGVNGAFLTGDLFNLFVFFEIMLAASYGLVLHGSGEERIRAGLTYIAVNLTASLFFLIGVALIYGSAGTLNMADLAVRIAGLTDSQRPLFEAGCAILGVAFLVKASLWPLGFWLPPTYAAASAPAAAILAILSKVGVYVMIRLNLLLFGPEAGLSAGFGQSWLLIAGLATVVFGTAGILAAKELRRAAGYAVMISSGTILAVVGTGNEGAIAGALFYLIGSTLAAAAVFLLAEVMERGRRSTDYTTARVFEDEYNDPFEDDDFKETGLVIPATVAVLGGGFLLCTLILAGLPPLAGFIGKLSILSSLFAGDGAGVATSWIVLAILTLSSFGTLIALVKFGIKALWVPSDEPAPLVKAPEFVAIAGLVLACLILTPWGNSVNLYADHTAEWLKAPAGYVTAVLGRGAS